MSFSREVGVCLSLPILGGWGVHILGCLGTIPDCVQGDSGNAGSIYDVRDSNLVSVMQVHYILHYLSSCP